MSRVDVASVDGWMRACSTAFVPLGVRSATPSFTASLAQAELSPEVTLTWVTSGVSEVFRDRRKIAQDPRDDVLLSIHRAGRGAVRQSGRIAHLRPGMSAVYDAASPYELTFSTHISELVLQVPRRLLQHRVPRIEDVTARPLPSTPSLRALISLAAAVDPREGDRAAVENASYADALSALLVAALADEHSGAAPLIDPDLLYRSMVGYIDERAEDPNLSPEVVARAHHVSLRLVQKLFAHEGDSPAAYLRRVRLHRSHERLQRGMSVGSAASGSGFVDVDSFTRAFKREFGYRPSDARVRGGVGVAGSAGA